MKQKAWFKSQIRLGLVLGLFFLVLLALIGRLIYLSTYDRKFLLHQSQSRVLRTLTIPAYRGMILDRSGLAMAISTPMGSVWVNPKEFSASASQAKVLTRLLGWRSHRLMHKISIEKRRGREFVYLRRLMAPIVVSEISKLHIPGVHVQREYKRFYPDGAVSAHVIGLTNVDDVGQEGLELSYNQWLSGVDGKREVVKDRIGRTISNLDMLKKPVQGKNLILSINHQIQFLAYRVLKQQVEKYHASSGSVVVLDSQTGEILADVNQPTFNPNNRPKVHDGRYRNRALTDIFEPGSTMKPFTIALALQSGKYTPASLVDTSPGRLAVGGYTIKDDGLNYGVISLTQVLQKSSNIGAAKIMLSLSPKHYWELLQKFGFGQRTASGYPGESAGTMVARADWYPSVVATLAYGYGIAVTTLQLAHGYQILANGGVKMPITFLKRDSRVIGQRVISKKVSKEVVNMLETVVEKGGTGWRAAVPDYRVAGKTGTAYIAGRGGYNRHQFIASFVGLAPASHPRLVVAVIIRDPKGQHFGGIVSAPVFSKVMSGALRIMDVAPDDLSQIAHQA